MVVEASERVEVAFELPGGKILGRVVHADSGQPLAGAVVRIASETAVGGADPSEFGFEVTGERGEFRFFGLEAGTYTIIADEHLTTGASARSGGRLEGVQLAEGEVRTGLELRARAAAGMSVLVTDEHGAPLERVMLMATDRAGKPIGTLPLAFSDASGRAHLAGLPAGDVRVVASRDDLAPGYSGAVHVSPGADARCTVVLAAGTAACVAIVDQSGRRFPDAGRVDTLDPRDGGWSVDRLDESTARGRLDRNRQGRAGWLRVLRDPCGVRSAGEFARRCPTPAVP